MPGANGRRRLTSASWRLGAESAKFAGMNTHAAPCGALLRRWREQRRLTQSDLALAADSSTRHLSARVRDGGLYKDLETHAGALPPRSPSVEAVKRLLNLVAGLVEHMSLWIFKMSVHGHSIGIDRPPRPHAEFALLRICLVNGVRVNHLD